MWTDAGQELRSRAKLQGLDTKITARAGSANTVDTSERLVVRNLGPSLLSFDSKWASVGIDGCPRLAAFESGQVVQYFWEECNYGILSVLLAAITQDI